MSDIDSLREQYPAIFELIGTLQVKIAEAQESLQSDLQRLRSHEATRDQISERYARYRAEIDPMRKQIEVITSAIGKLITPAPVFVAPI